MTMCAATSTLILVDLQARLMPAIDRGEAVLARCRLLAHAARLLGVPVFATEQNPRGLGATVEPIAPLAERIFAKVAFDASAESGLARAIDPHRRDLVVAGCETHVCVLQTALGLKQHGFAVTVVADAVGSRRFDDRDAALRRMARHGIEIVTSEMVAFEWMARSDHPKFREVLALLR
jgi:nicotinamidase-related amidase